MEDLTQSQEQQQDSCSMLVIDGDAIPYIIAWNNKEHSEVEIVHNAVDSFMNDFLTITQAPQFIGIIANDNSRCFRYDVYKFKPYKGNRQGEKEPWIAYWEPIIRKYLQDKWGFVQAPSWLETDDIVAMLALDNLKAVICSPDKDLRQISGYFYNYKNLGTETSKGIEVVTKQEAYRNFCMQLLTGDTTDNIAGVVNMGEVKARKLLEETSEMLWMNAIKLAYQKQYGPYYGDIIYRETLNTIQMFTSQHPLWEAFTGSELANRFLPIEDYTQYIRNTSEYGQSIRGRIESQAFG
jgi:hypothetical protein